MQGADESTRPGGVAFKKQKVAHRPSATEESRKVRTRRMAPRVPCWLSTRREASLPGQVSGEREELTSYTHSVGSAREIG